jgi:DNA-binding HxlR family transcriptional regulator
LARAAEILGERWTLLVIRELLLGPIRFSELRRHLSQVSPSVLSARVQGLEGHGLVERRELPPPASVSVIQLTEFGENLRPVVLALTRFGLRLLGPPEPDDHFEPSWLRLGFHVIARTTATPKVAFGVTIKDGAREFVVEIRGGPNGTSVRDVPEGEVLDTHVQIRGEGMTLMALASGALDPVVALNNDQIEATGRASDLAKFPRLFHFGDASRVDPNRAR